MKHTVKVFVILAISLMSACQRAGHLSVDSAWARPGNSGSNSAAYFTINNRTSQPDLLLSAASDVTRAAEIHLSRMREDGAMEMRPQENVPVPAGSSVQFEPGGLHVMLIDLNRDLQPGDTFQLRLFFQSAGQFVLDVQVAEN